MGKIRISIFALICQVGLMNIIHKTKNVYKNKKMSEMR